MVVVYFATTFIKTFLMEMLTILVYNNILSVRQPKAWGTPLARLETMMIKLIQEMRFNQGDPL